MVRFQFAVEIARPIDEVFAFVTDPRLLPRWQKNTVEVEPLTPGPLREGTRIREVHKGLGTRMESIVEVAELRPTRRFALRVVSGPMPIHGSWDFQPVEGGTRLTFVGEGELTGPRRKVEWLVGGAVKRQMITHHRRLKRLLERGR